MEFCQNNLGNLQTSRLNFYDFDQKKIFDDIPEVATEQLLKFLDIALQHHLKRRKYKILYLTVRQLRSTIYLTLK